MKTLHQKNTMPCHFNGLDTPRGYYAIRWVIHRLLLFQKWLKSNAGKTYGDAINAYYQILEEKKKGKTTIGKQFEYNTYIRDFFEDNQGRSLDEAITCWKYKKSLQGHNRYEKSDLVALD